MIHLFSRAGMQIALDVGSGAVHVLDEAAYAMLQCVHEEELRTGKLTTNLHALEEKYGKEDVAEIFDALCDLTKQNLLYSDDSYYDTFENQLGPAPVKAMCLHIAHDCNLRCKYCFASTGDFGGSRTLMSDEVAQKAMDLLISLSANRHNLEVDFFGGEPLMNFGVVERTIQYARSLEKKHNKNFRFTITTNGMALNQNIIDTINREMSNVVLSLDGRKEVNDAMRPKIDGSGSFDSIVPKYQKLVAQRGDKEYYVRGTYTKHNLDFDKDVLALYDLGFDQISVEPVVGPDYENYSIQEADIPEIEKSYERLMDTMIERRKKGEGKFNFFHFMLDLDNGPCAIKRLKGCGSGNEYLAVTPGGELYPCHQFADNPDFLMGTVWEGITRTDLKETFAAANVLKKDECRNCWAKYFCSGGCNANNYNYAGALTTPYKVACELEKIRLECAIAIQASKKI